MANAASPEMKSRNLIDEFLRFTKQIALEIVKADIEIAIYLIDKKIPEEKVLEIKKAEQPGVQLVSCLKQYHLLSVNNLDYFIELLKESRRVDLADRVKEYQRTVDTVKNATPVQIKERIPANNMESLSLIMPGQTDTITVDTLDHIKETICGAIEIKRSELFYVATANKDQLCSQLSLQFPGIEKKIMQLQLDALNKMSWLTGLGVVELKVDIGTEFQQMKRFAEGKKFD